MRFWGKAQFPSNMHIIRLGSMFKASNSLAKNTIMNEPGLKIIRMVFCKLRFVSDNHLLPQADKDEF